MAQCNHTARTTGQRCRREAEPGKLVCVLHRNRTPAGINSPHYRGKGRSKYMPPEMTARYKEALADEQRLFDITEDMGLIETRLRELLGRVTTGESKRAWDDLGAANKALKDAMRKRDDGEIQVALNALGDLIEQGQADYAAWAELHDILKTRSRLIIQDHKMRLEEKRLLPIEQVVLLMQAVLTLVKDNVKDPEALENIRRGYISLANIPDRNLLTTTARVVGES